MTATEQRQGSKDIATLVGSSPWARQLLEHDQRMADDPEYAAEFNAREAKLQAERERREREYAAATMRRRRERLLEVGVPAKDLDAALDGALFASGALKVAQEWLASDKRILVLSGARGVGKTTAAAWLAVHVDGARFVEAPRLMRVDTYSDEAMLPLERCPLLVLDDMGTEYADVKGKLISLVDGLVNARYSAMLRTVITTNLPAADQDDQGVRRPGFKTRYGERVADRIREVGKFVELAGGSLRGGAR